MTSRIPMNDYALYMFFAIAISYILVNFAVTTFFHSPVYSIMPWMTKGGSGLAVSFAYSAGIVLFGSRCKKL